MHRPFISLSAGATHGTRYRCDLRCSDICALYRNWRLGLSNPRTHQLPQQLLEPDSVILTCPSIGSGIASGRILGRVAASTLAASHARCRIVPAAGSRSPLCSICVRGTPRAFRMDYRRHRHRRLWLLRALHRRAKPTPSASPCWLCDALENEQRFFAAMQSLRLGGRYLCAAACGGSDDITTPRQTPRISWLALYMNSFFLDDAHPLYLISRSISPPARARMSCH